MNYALSDPKYYLQKKQPMKWVFSETIPLSEQIKEDAEYMKQTTDYINKEVRKAIK